ncbi:MAG: thioredoxin family protein [Patescibacteria group bacterium]|nr:thioredoxin family protein [Patescibacteria group bacterium]
MTARNLSLAGILSGRRSFAKILFVCLCLTASVASSMPLTDDDGLDAIWCRETPERRCLERAKNSGRETVAVFGATWCSGCRFYKQRTLGDPQVREQLRRYQLVYVDTDINRDAVDRYRINSWPSTLFLRSDRESGRLKGVHSPDSLLRFLRESSGQH